MKKNEMKRLLQGLKNLQSNYYCEFSEKEHFILEWAISLIKEIIEPKKKWIEMVRQITKTIVLICKLF